MSLKSVGGTFQLPAVFSSQRSDISMQPLDTYKEAYFNLNLAQREAVFSFSNTQFFAKYNGFHFEFFKQDIADGNTPAGRVKAACAKKNLLIERFDFSGNDSTSPKKAFSLVNKDPLTQLLSLNTDFLKNPRRVRSKAAYLPDIWHKLLDHEPTTWQALDAVFVQVLEFCFLLEFYASPNRPFDRILRLHPSPRDLELGGFAPNVAETSSESPELDEALLDSLNDVLAKPTKAKAKRNKNKGKSKSVATTPATATSLTSSPRRWQVLRTIPDLPEVSIITKNTFLHFAARAAALNTPRRRRAQTDGAILVT